MKKRLSLWLTAIASLIGALLLHAENTPAGAPPDVSIQFRIFAWGTSVSSLTYGQKQTVDEIDDGTLSPIQTYSGPPTLVFTRTPATTDTVPTKPPSPVASITIPQGLKKITLLTVPNGHHHYTMYPIPSDTTSLTTGHARLTNLTTQRLLITYGSQRVELAPGASVLIAGTSTGKAIVIQVSSMTNGHSAALFNNVIQLDATGGPNVLFLSGQPDTAVSMFVMPRWPTP